MDSDALARHLKTLWPAGPAVATSAQLADSGISDRVIAAALRRGLVFRLRRGAYIQASSWKAQKPWDRDANRMLAHILTVRGTPVYSYFSAARLHGLYLWNCGATVHVTRASAASGTGNPKDVIVHHEPLGAGETVVFRLRTGHRVSATSKERTVVDCARIGSFTQAVILGDAALRKGASLDAMWAMVEGMPGHRGVRRARRVLRALDARSESPGESRTRLIIATMDIEQPLLQFELQVGDRVYRPDFLWKEAKLIVEFDGDIKYFNYQRTDQVLLEERKRERRLMEMGWRFVRLEWQDLTNPEGVRQRILDAYRSQLEARAA